MTNMDAVLTDLYATPPQALPFASSISMRTFLCRRDRGNLLIYGGSDLSAEVTAVQRLGGVSRHYLNHCHEAEVAGRPSLFPTYVHEDDSSAAAESIGAVETFSRRGVVGDDFEVIPIPGHTLGATAFLWDQGEHRILFTGDTVYLTGTQWVAAMLESSDREKYAASLELIRDLEFDLLVPWIATRDQPFVSETSPQQTRRRIDLILERLRRGAGR